MFIRTLSTNGLRHTSTNKAFSTRHLNHCYPYKTCLKSSSDSTNEKSMTDEKRWFSVNLGDEKDSSKAVMKKRLEDAERWEQRKLSDEDSNTLNRLLGIEKEMYELESSPLSSSSLSNKNTRDKKIKSLQRLTSPSKNSELKGFLEMNPYICSGCGTPFQSKADTDPGFLPKDKFTDHRIRAESIKLQQDAIRILDQAGIEIDSETAMTTLREANVPEIIISAVRQVGRKISQRKNSRISNYNKHNDDEDDDNQIQLQTKGDQISQQDVDNNPISNQDENSIAEIDESQTVPSSVCICQRCYRLQQYNQIEENLRPGWSTHELLTPERFQELLQPIKETVSIVICIVDLFDLKGSIVKNLKDIIGPNPLVIACNKIDLLPKDISHERIKSWIYNELQTVCGLKTPRVIEDEKFVKRSFASDRINKPFSYKDRTGDKNDGVDDQGVGILRRSNIHLVSCQTGQGMDKLVDDVMAMAKDNGEKVYVMGNANVGKSSFINYWIEGNSRKKSSQQRKFFEKPPAITVSNLPGTTLDFLKIKLPNGVQMIDTPGLINRSQLTSRLTVQELKKVIPVKPINTVTLRVNEGKSVLIGGLASIELVTGKSFFFTFFISNEVKMHPTNSTKIQDILTNPLHVGKLIDPPSTVERIKELGVHQEHIFNIQGEGWTKSSTDIVISGLGWVTITGSGQCQIKVSVPEGIEVATRAALLPYESSTSTAKFSGSRILKTSKKKGSGKAYGWRA